MDVHFDKLFSWVSVTLPQYTIPELKRTSIVKFMRLTHEAEQKQKNDLNKARNNNRESRRFNDSKG